MTNPSTYGEDFLVNGVSLYTLAYNIWTMAGREQAPPLIGNNTAIPFRDGRIWMPKTFDQRVLTLGMWVVGTDVDGNIPAAGPRAQFNENVRTLKKLFLPRAVAAGEPLLLTRKLLFADGIETHTAFGDAFNPASSGFQAGGGGGMGTDMFDLVPVTPVYGTFTVDIIMASPWWHGTTTTQTVTFSGLGSFTLDNIGDVYDDHPVVTFNGPLVNPIISNGTSAQPLLQLWYNGTIAAGDSVTIDCGSYAATLASTGASVIGNVFHSGSMKWMVFWPGNNSCSFATVGGGSPGTGNAQIAWAPQYS